MKKFEYQVLDSKSGFWGGVDREVLTERLNQLGSQGWEVVATTPLTAAGTTTSLVITLKREVG